MKKPLILCIALLGFCLVSNAQRLKHNPNRHQYLIFETGVVVDSYNSLGVRLFFEYQHHFSRSKKLLYGISYENSRNLTTRSSTEMEELSTNLNVLSGNMYYRINLSEEKIYWTLGGGVGVVHAFWEDNDRLGIAFNLSSTISFRLNNRLYFQTAPMIVSRAYVSPMDAASHRLFYAYNFLPIGLMIKL